ncbi:hypothetical protein KCV87_02535 [Actinosynnema pretiosum subsp. pretiosum]|uniref:Secreted protein n=1 Tax=Actinosynnema pretiosum subsp. pretiosum TaxID=103721 RepID=A0AA45L854_9PSEU|nr:hypothetical protein KCV87_02535 [Actinosynnema pretiosum subsp. pretiosum]
MRSRARSALQRRALNLARTTPGRLTLLALALAGLSLLVGLLTAQSVQRRTDALSVLADQTEPLAYAAQEVYRAMADADATAASAFLSGGVESPQLRQRYEDDIARASSALSAATDAPTRAGPLADEIDTLAQQLPVYTGLVETARVHNRQGNPVGAAYLREASELMRGTLLPAAHDLHRAQSDATASELAAAGVLPWTELLLGGVLLSALAGAQRYLFLTSNRLLNIGLVVASAASVIALMWSLVASLVVVADTGAGQTAARQVDVLAQARITTLSARGDETLALVTRGGGATAYEDGYRRLDGELEELLAQAHAGDAGEHHRRWQRAHAMLRAADDRGDWEGAVDLALGTGSEGAASAFDALDRDLVDALVAARTEANGAVASARGALGGAVDVVAFLSAIAAFACLAGVWQRLKEYR